MPFEPTDRLPLGQSGLRRDPPWLRGGLHRRPVSKRSPRRTPSRPSHAPGTLGVRMFDVAPLYGYGTAERRIGMALADRPRDEFVLSTKVGRLVRPGRRDPARRGHRRPGDRRARRRVLRRTEPVRVVFDYSRRRRSAVARGEPRAARPRPDRHRPDPRSRRALGGRRSARPGRRSHRLREEGTVRAIGVGMNQSAMLARFAREGDFDVFLLAGRYTLLDQERADRPAAACASSAGSASSSGGVMNSGVLADPRPGSRVRLPAGATRGRRASAADRDGLRAARRAACGRRRSSSRSPIRRSCR